MAKKKITKAKKKPTPAASAGGPTGWGNPIGDFFASKAMRETIESVAIAFILAFLFRTFEAEAFVIPTGSMAPTLMGRHKDMLCGQCGFPYQAGASEESTRGEGDVVGTTCPMCRFIDRIQPGSPDHPYYTGDRILVSKFIYDFTEPRRWDVVVFKYPNNAKQNYIKRLVGTPDETVRIRHGDLWVKHLLAEDDDFVVARKPLDKLQAMLQHVYDTHYIPQTLADKVGDASVWPARWQGLSADWQQHDESTTQGGVDVVHREFTIDADKDADGFRWLRYHHYTPNVADWQDIQVGRQPARPPEKLISDFYAYNAYIHGSNWNWRDAEYSSLEPLGMHWVGDLALFGEVEITSDQGSLALDLVEAGRHYRAAIDVATGKATLSIVGIDGTEGEFSADDGSQATKTVSGQTAIKGPGHHRLMLANVDHAVLLMVDGKLIKFDGPRTVEGFTPYRTDGKDMPDWNEEDAGDLAPAGIGSRGAGLRVRRLRLKRDIYYISVKLGLVGQHQQMLSDYTPPYPDHLIRECLGHPRQMRDNPSERIGQLVTFADVFDARREVDFDLGADQFFTMGDNSPQSQDARIWGMNNFVERKYLTGKALFIYWPHAKREPFPFTPNFERMRFVR